MDINKDYALGAGEGSSQRTANKFIILHETATEAPAKNNAIFEKNNWASNETYVQFIVGDGGHVYQVGEPGYVAWGAGTFANANAPVQIELARTRNKEQFKQDYAAYIQLAREMADKFGIPKTLDTPDNGIKTHNWVSQNYWGDHTDPVKSYLQPYWGITQGQLASDLANGVGNVNVSGGSTPAHHGNYSSTFPGFTPEKAHFKVGDAPIQVRVGQPGLSAAKGGKLYPGDVINYDGWKNQGGYTWVHYIGNTGDNLFLPTHPTGSANNIWGTFY